MFDDDEDEHFVDIKEESESDKEEQETTKMEVDDAPLDDSAKRATSRPSWVHRQNTGS